MSIDQIAAREIGSDTSFASLELATEPDLYVGGHSFRAPNQVLPMEYNPRKLFDRLFGPGDSLRERATILESTGSVLDRIQAEAQRFHQTLGAADRGRMDDYLTSVRDVERQIQNMVAKDFSGVAVPDAPVGIPSEVDEQINIMFDLLALAYQADLTRVATLRIAAEQTVRTYTNLGISDAFHPISHHGHRHANYAKLIKIQTYHSQVVARFLAKLDAFPETDGSSVLDNSVLSVRQRHERQRLAQLEPVAARGVRARRRPHQGQSASRVHGRHALQQFLLTLLERAAVPAESVGNSSGDLAEV